jgi:hypothetical protein
MLTGKQYSLNRATLGLHISEDGNRSAVQLPEHAVVKVVSGPKTMGSEGVVDVLWEGKIVAIFLVDLQARGEEVSGKSAHG